MIGISKKEKVGHEPYHPDLLSNLPLGITHKILALLPVREAVKTCILSSQWRYTWVTLPQLVFKERCPIHRSIDEFQECMEKFITNVLLHHQGPIYKFQMSVPISPCPQAMDQWMLCLSRNDIRKLIINMSYDESCSSELYSAIYSCRKLTYLELFSCEMDKPPPSFKGFLYLRDLHFRNVFFCNQSDGAIDSVFANSPLENLNLTECDSSELSIYAPSLKYLFLRGNHIKLYVHAPLLAEMFVGLDDDDFSIDYVQEDDSECNYTSLLGSKTKLEKLIVDFYSMKYLSFDIVSSYRPSVFPCLKVIKLFGVNAEIIRDMLVVARLVADAPNLEKLKIDSLAFTESEFLPDLNAKKVHVIDIKSALNSTFGKLRLVSIRGVRGHVLEMELIRYLREKSPVLEVMRLEICYEISGEDREILRDVLQSSSCASPIAKITFYAPPPKYAHM